MSEQIPYKPPSRCLEFLCQLPEALGAVIKLTTVNGGLVADTESGVPFIVPIHKPKLLREDNHGRP